MGGHYARLSGEPEEVAAAIAEQYEAVSATRPGLALALADRLDSLMALFAAGFVPKGSNDPFALRRAAIQLIENLVANRVSLDLRRALASAAGYLPRPAGPEAVDGVLEFISGRLEVLLMERGARTSAVRAAIAAQGADPYRASLAAEALSQTVQRAGWPALLDAYARCARITRDQPAFELRPSELRLPPEEALHAAYRQASPLVDGSVEGLVEALERLQPAIDRFFETTLVMDEDPAIRQNRLALLQRIAALPRGVADLSLLEGF
jgi:glycyl-tRNA synthetase